MNVRPVIISASRATDIPAFYPDWFMNRLRAGYCIKTNPFNGKPSRVSFEHARVFVFWSKNPAPFISCLDELDRRSLGYYFQFTLNDYEPEKLEPGVPPLARRIDTFITLSQRIGPEKMIWRFDPLFLSDALTVSMLVDRMARVGDRIAPHTRKLVFSFADIHRYAKVRRNVSSIGNTLREFTQDEMTRTGEMIGSLCRRWGISAATCAETVDLSGCGIAHNKCIDDDLLRRLFPGDAALMSHLGAVTPKDKGQRKECWCIASRDIGAYSSCPHLCRYCYANSSDELVTLQHERHNPASETLLNG